VGNKIALGAIVKPIVCVYFLNTDLTKSRIGLMDFKRMGEVEGVLVAYNFDSVLERSTTTMNLETTGGTLIGYTRAFFAAKVASECDPLPKEGQWVVVDFGFHGGR
jgi:hypothetical protein